MKIADANKHERRFFMIIDKTNMNSYCFPHPFPFPEHGGSTSTPWSGPYPYPPNPNPTLERNIKTPILFSDLQKSGCVNLCDGICNSVCSVTSSTEENYHTFDEICNGARHCYGSCDVVCTEICVSICG